MTYRLVCVAFVFIGVIFNLIIQIRAQEKCGIQNSELHFPWVVGLEYLYPSKILNTGALISRSHVIANKLSTQFYGGPKSIRLGLYNSKDSCTSNKCMSDGTIRIFVEKISQNSNFALIKLIEDAPDIDAFRPICLPSIDVTLSAAADLDLFIIGYSDFKSPASYLNHAECNVTTPSTASTICVKHAELSNNCLYFGGILMNKRGNHYELLGLFENGSCITKKLFSKLFFYLDWIQGEILGGLFEYRSTDIFEIATTATPPRPPVECGKRKVEHVELIVSGQITKAGDWPWHVAIYKLKGYDFRYICGGTLISKTLVLTAAHCATEQGVPVTSDILSVILGKYNLIGGDIQSQERRVHLVIVHEGYSQRNHLENDIALLKLRTEATYNDYVQPACIWSSKVDDRLPIENIYGTVVGWGINLSNTLSPQLNQAKMPMVSDLTCIKIDPLLYTKLLGGEKKFCGGWANGTSACNGDSGGAFAVFVPDTSKVGSFEAEGSWYVRGIVSLSPSIRNEARCNPNQYVVFTDVNKYTDWIQRHF